MQFIPQELLQEDRMISPEKCPICFRQLGTWKKDPIFLPNGGPYLWTSDTEIIREDRLDHRLYKGFQQVTEPMVQEIQDFLKQTEIDNLKEDRTEFSPLNLNMKFQITGKHIKEMRDSVEKLLTFFGLTKTNYFNYDEEGKKITSPDGDKLEWTDPITNAVDLKKFQVKAIHIEDLRHYIPIIGQWKERFLKIDSPFSQSDSFSLTQPIWAPQTEPHFYAKEILNQGWQGLDGHQWVNGSYSFIASALVDGGIINASSSVITLNGGLSINSSGTATGRNFYNPTHGWTLGSANMNFYYFIETYNTYLSKGLNDKSDFNITGSWKTSPSDSHVKSYFHITLKFSVLHGNPYGLTELNLVFYSGWNPGNLYSNRYYPIGSHLNIFSILNSFGFNPIWFVDISRIIISAGLWVDVTYEELSKSGNVNANITYMEIT